MNRNVICILFYVSECWKLNVKMEKRVLVFENICLRRTLKISLGESHLYRDLPENWSIISYQTVRGSELS